MAEDKGAGSAKPRTSTPAKKAPAKAEKAEPKAPTPESIGIEGVVRVGGHRLDEEQGWVPDDESLEPEPDDASDEED